MDSQPDSRRLFVRAVVFLLILGGIALFTIVREPGLSRDEMLESLVEPRVIAQNPRAGQELPVGEDIKVYFNVPMHRGSVEAALRIRPGFSHEVIWMDDMTLVIQPKRDLPVGRSYEISIGERARSQEGRPLSESVSLGVRTVGYVEVTHVLPSSDARDVSPNSVITVTFNRPMVPLELPEPSTDSPNPLLISPRVSGQGEWIGTSIYKWKPSRPLEGNREYTVRVDPDVRDVMGTQLGEEFSWTFQVMGPQVDEITLSGYEDPQLPDMDIRVQFNLPMDRASVEQAFSLVNQDTGQHVQGSFEWFDNDRVFIFTPAALLDLDSSYEIEVSTEAHAQGGTRLSAPKTRTFSTLPHIAVTDTYPENGESQYYYSSYGSVSITFNAPVDEDTVHEEGRITITPELPNEPRISVNRWGAQSNVWISGQFKSSTRYTVTVSAGIADTYGNVLEEPYTFSFTTVNPGPRLQVNLGEAYGMYDASQPTRIALLTRDIAQVDFKLYQVPVEDLPDILSGYSYRDDLELPDAPPLREWSVAPTGPEDEVVMQTVPLAEDGGALPPGVYLLTYRTPGSGNSYRRSFQYLFVTNANLTVKAGFDETLVWATDLQTAAPLPGLNVSVYGTTSQDEDAPLEWVGQAQTDQEGVAQIATSEQQSPEYWYYSYYGMDSYALVQQDGVFAISLPAWSQGIRVSEFGMPVAYSDVEQTLYVYTDRPLYRPGQVVYFKGILRSKEDMLFSLPTGIPSVSVRVENLYENRTIYSGTAALDDMGTFSGEFTIPDDALLGRYAIYVDTGEEHNNNRDWWAEPGELRFDIAEYRKPEFEVELTPISQNVLDGETVEVTVQANYYFGGAVADANVEWQVWVDSASFTYAGNSRYRFSDYRYYSDYYYYSYYGYEYDYHYLPTLASGAGTTTSDGTMTLRFDADIAEDIGPQRLIIEATVVEDPAHPVTGRTDVTAHSSQYYVGIYNDAHYMALGDAVTAELIVVDWLGHPIANQTVTIQPVDQQWERVRSFNSDGYASWSWTVEETPVGEPLSALTDASGKAQVSVIPGTPGSLKLRAAVADPLGNSATSSAYLWVSSSRFARWRGQGADDQIDLIADATLYAPGDTAELLITSPYLEEVQALVTVERDGILSHDVFTFTGPTYAYQLPITSDHAPNIFVSVVLIKGVDDSNPVPDFKMGLTRLNVSPSEQTLQVTVTPDKAYVVPDEQVAFTVAVTDAQGQPVVADVSLALVDRALLALKGPNSPPIGEHFYGPQRLGVHTWISMTALFDRLLPELLPDPEGAGGGGGGGGGPTPDTVVREEFEDTAYWQAHVRTGPDGTALVTVEMPDNLTTWRLDARAVTSDTRVGQAEVDVVTTIPLLVRPLTPRFFVADDRVELGASVNNNTDTAIAAVVSLEAAGIILDGPAAQAVTIPAHGVERVYWPVSVAPGAEWVDLTFRVEGGGFADAAKPEIGDAENQHMLPVLRFVVTETTGTSGHVPQAGTRTEAVVLPPDYEVLNPSLTVQIDYSLAGSALDAATWLEHYPYECNEQWTSKFLPNVLTLKMLRELNQSNPALERSLIEQVQIGLDIIYQRQNEDGGWGWWPGDTSNPTTTAYVVHGLVLAQQAGIDVQDPVLAKGFSYLQNIRRAVNDDSRQTLNRQVYVEYVYELAEKPSRTAEDRLDELYKARRSMDHYAVALLAQALWMRNPDDARLDTLHAMLNDAAVTSDLTTHWEEESNDYWNWNTDTRSTAIILDTYARIWPDDELAPGAVRWLMRVRQLDHWSTTQETIWSLIALTDWLVLTQELETHYDWSIHFNGQAIASGTATPGSIRESEKIEIDLSQMIGGGQDRMVVGRGEGPGRLYYSAYLTGYLPVEQVQAESRGVTINRRYLDGEGNSITQARVGNVITVEVSVIVPTEMHYLIIEDYYPAGAEAVNSELLTESGTFRPPSLSEVQEGDGYWGWWWWRHFDIQLKDEKAIATADFVSPGTYLFTYQVRLGVAGEYHVIPAVAWEFYFPEVYGRTGGSLFTVLRADDH